MIGEFYVTVIFLDFTMIGALYVRFLGFSMIGALDANLLDYTMFDALYSTFLAFRMMGALGATSFIVSTTVLSVPRY